MKYTIFKYTFALGVTIGTICAGQSTTVSPNPVVNMVMYGADPSGIKDSAPAIRAMVASLGSSAATLYFPRGTYRFASPGPLGAEECVRITRSISLLGDGPGATIFADDPTPACMSLVGYFYTNSVAVRDSDYSFEYDPGFPVVASTASITATTLTLATPSSAALYAGGQYVYLKGSSLGQAGQYRGELNRIASTGDGKSGTITLLWPLSSDFTQDGNVQLNMVASSEVLTNIQISGITFAFHNNAVLAAQVLGLQIYNNAFTYLGHSSGNEVSQYNQNRNVEFFNNVVTNPIGPALDIERSSTRWNIYNNTFYGYFDAGEGSANINFHDNNVTCVNTEICIRFGGTTGNTVNHNQITASCPADYCHAVTDVSGPVTSPGTVISNNTIVSNGPRAIAVHTPGTVVSGNTIFTQGTGIDIAAGGITAFNNSVTLTASGVFGCVLVESDTHNVLIQGLTCNGFNGLRDRAIWVTDNGPQTHTPLIVNGLSGSNLNVGVYLSNALNDLPIVDGLSLTNTFAPVTGAVRTNF